VPGRFGVVASLWVLFAVQDIQIRPRFVAGDEFRLEVTRVREDAARPQSSYSGRSPVDVRVVSAGADGFVLDWKPGAAVIDNPQLASDPALRLAGRILGNAQFRIVLNADGEFVRVANEAELKPKLEAIVDAMLRSLQAGMAEAERKKMDDFFRQVLSPANLIAIATRDAQTYVGLNGLALALGDTLELTIEQPTAFGGTVPAVFRARMESATPETATITTTTTFDPDALKKMTMAIVEQVGGKGSPDELATFRIEMSDDGKFVFDRKLGLMREVTVNRRGVSGGVKRLDRWVIRLVSEPKR
jgi:hypothetical protein